MKKASHILFTVSKILSFVAGGIVLACALIFFICYGLFLNGTLYTENPDTDFALATMFLVLGIIYAIWGIILFINGAISNMGQNEPNHTTYILNIVFGLLSLIEVNLVGGIFGLIAEGKEAKKE